MKTITLNELRHLQANGELTLNKYEEDRLIADENLAKELLAYGAEIFCVLSEQDGKLYFEHSKVILSFGRVSVEVNKHTNKSKPEYTFALAENFTDIHKSDRERIYSEFERPKNVGVLTARKVNEWLVYLTKCFDVLIEKRMRVRKNVADFLDEMRIEGVEVREVKHNNNKYVGTVSKNGIRYSFTINDYGYIDQKIELDYYPLRTDYQTFLDLSSNGVTMPK